MSPSGRGFLRGGTGRRELGGRDTQRKAVTIPRNLQLNFKDNRHSEAMAAEQQD